MKSNELKIKTRLFEKISEFIEESRSKVAIYLNTEVTLLY